MNAAEDILTFDADNKEVLQRKLRDITSGLGVLFQRLEENELSKELAQSVLQVVEFNLSGFSEISGIPTQTAADIEERYREIRTANLRIRELEKKLGEGVTPQSLQSAMRNLGDKLNRWWDLEGFGHISDIQFSSYGNCQVDFSCSLFGTFPVIHSSKPVSDKEAKELWIQSLRDRGFVLVEESRRELALEDCDVNRKLLQLLFKQRFPKSAIISFTNHGNREGVFVLRDVKVIIYDLESIEGLPQAPQED